MFASVRVLLFVVICGCRGEPRILASQEAALIQIKHKWTRRVPVPIPWAFICFSFRRLISHPCLFRSFDAHSVNFTSQSWKEPTQIQLTLLAVPSGRCIPQSKPKEQIKRTAIHFLLIQNRRLCSRFCLLFSGSVWFVITPVFGTRQESRFSKESRRIIRLAKRPNRVSC